jgi:hypothetical protein
MAQAAFAHEFINSPANTGFLGKGGTQTITLGGHVVSCKSAAINGHAVVEFLEMEVQYESCEAFSKSATVSQAAFKDTANGSGGIAENATMTITVKPTPLSKCVYTLHTTLEPVTSVSYTNSEKGITINSALKGLTYELEETGTTVCGKNGEKSNTGEYEGKVTTESFEESKCVFWAGGAYGWPSCTGLYSGVMEITTGYKTLQWS